jgi:hypothetical protein
MHKPGPTAQVAVLKIQSALKARDSMVMFYFALSGLQHL